MIKQYFLESLKNYTLDSSQHQTMWDEIEKNYSKSNRHYHNLTHLNALVNELQVWRDKFANWDVIIFAIAYHDIIYNTLKNNNEEKSADVAVKRLSKISFPESLTVFCEQLILATKKHEYGNEQTNLFTDADLSILGSDPETYKTYSSQIRREYSIFPDIVYNPGRRKVLLHFLAMDQIFKTKEFSARYESNARINLQEELNAMTSTT